MRRIFIAIIFIFCVFDLMGQDIVKTEILGQEIVAIIENNNTFWDYVNILAPIIGGLLVLFGVRIEVKNSKKKFKKQKIEEMFSNIQNIDTAKKQLVSYIQNDDTGDVFLNEITGKIIHDYNNFYVIYSLYFKKGLKLKDNELDDIKNYSIIDIPKIAKEIKDSQNEHFKKYNYIPYNKPEYSLPDNEKVEYKKEILKLEKLLKKIQDNTIEYMKML